MLLKKWRKNKRIPHRPKNKEKIDKLYAIMSIDPDEKNGILGCEIEGTKFPAVFESFESIKKMYPLAKEFAAAENLKIGVFEFSNRKEIEI